ncbi:transposase [Synoicihabitans lomoniglobus]|uniref:Transposase n=1 Tax=Synoicihabitans lomoniglobus TaxID=2909285 RepID=A0AAF0CMP6_9BACT|nr:transposase [Opitutaceae bacterium LMO-M01]WED63335.1 transposase [Opitutaceae bacterium LMO-M01]
MPTGPQRQTARLLLGRVSAPGAVYFVTMCTSKRAQVLTLAHNLSSVRSTLADTFSHDNSLHAACVMPDHVHLLFTLGKRLTVGQVMGKFKASVRRRSDKLWTWQRNGFEHRLRETESEADYAFYIFMNPYRAHLVPITTAWSGWLCEDPLRYRFLAGLKPDGTPPPEWLNYDKSIAAKIDRSS